MRGLRRSLRWRLTAWVAAVLLACIAVLFAVVYLDTGSQLRGEIRRDVSVDVSELAQALSLAQPPDAAHLAAAAARYMRGRPYSAAASLLFVLLPSGQAVANHPEEFATSGREPGEPRAEQAVESRQARSLLVPRAGYSVLEVPDIGRTQMFERRVVVGGTQVAAGAGEPLALVERAQHGVARAFLLAGAVTLAIVLLVSYLAAARVTAPLRRLAAVAARVDAGDLAPRMQASPRAAAEVTVLAETFNHMLERLEQAFAAQRDFTADASHELRTPLTVIQGQLEVLAAHPHPPAEEVRRVERLVQAEVTRMSRLVEDLLLLARAEETDFLRPRQLELTPFVIDLWEGLSLTAERRFELGPLPTGTLVADPDRLAQALRNLATNAIEHTAPERGLVRLEVETLGDRIRFAVVDNGPGIAPDERERVFDRFHRLDPGRARNEGGAGLGLAIVRAIALAHMGQVHAVEPATGVGARVELMLPGFAPSGGVRRFEATLRWEDSHGALSGA